MVIINRERKKTGSRASILVRMILLLALVQVARAMLNRWMQSNAWDTQVLYTAAEALVLTVIGTMLFALARLAHIRLGALPAITSSKDRILYIAATVITVLLLLQVPLKTRDFSLPTLLAFSYTAVVLPVFEEILFRGYVWSRLRTQFVPEVTVCMVSAVLYGVWEAGYLDLLLAGGSLTAAGVVMSLITNMVFGLILGLITGLARLISKNYYPSILIHIVLSMVLR